MDSEMREVTLINNIYSGILWWYDLDVTSKCGVNSITTKSYFTPGTDYGREVRQQALKGRCPHRRGHLQSSTWQGARSEVPWERVFRSARCRAGQIRDAAPRLRRQGVGDRGLRGVWCFKADLLPGQGELRHRRDRRTGVGKAGPARPPQDRRGRLGVPAGTVDPGRAGSRSATGKSGPPRARY